MRAFCMWAAIIVGILVIFNVPRAAFIPWQPGDPVGILKGLKHGAIGFSYLLAWGLAAAGAYQIILGILYWDMETTEQIRWQFAMESAATARLLWATGAACLGLAIYLAQYVYRHDMYLWPPGVMSTLGALLACWFLWIAFPLYEQVGIDREELGV